MIGLSIRKIGATESFVEDRIFVILTTMIPQRKRVCLECVRLEAILPRLNRSASQKGWLEQCLATEPSHVPESTPKSQFDQPTIRSIGSQGRFVLPPIETDHAWTYSKLVHHDRLEEFKCEIPQRLVEIALSDNAEYPTFV